ncbi:MAG: Holliday junction branch migration protein RuvA [Candidatus Glassbacteria bacterium]|nr:Holliday junction branch migration protein RuvA [Candidatus Glassbacteria bacterium]
MIAMLEGILVEKAPGTAVISAGGVGYAVNIPLSTFEILPARDKTAKLFTYLHVREDTLQLFGFATREDRATFEKMISVSGVGPKLALTILSGMKVSDLVIAIETGQTDRLNKISGVGKKTAERLILELKGKLGEVDIALLAEDGAAGPLNEEAVDALLSLGFSRTQAEKAVGKAVKKTGDKLDTGELVRRALASM